jgi:hypothetical protein
MIWDNVAIELPDERLSIYIVVLPKKEKLKPWAECL